jgi:hypothetical protein
LMTDPVSQKPEPRADASIDQEWIQPEDFCHLAEL